MKPSSLEKKGLFTFYQDDGEDQIAQYLKNKQSSLQQTFTKQYISSKIQRQKEQKMMKIPKPQHQKEQIYRHNNKFSGITELLEKNRVRRNHNLLKIFLKKSQKMESSSQELKNRLQQLLNDQPAEKDSSKNMHQTPQQLNTSAIRLNQNMSIGRIKSKQKILLLNVPKKANRNLKNLVYSKVMGDLKTNDKLPRIEKVSLSADLSINTSQKSHQPYDDSKQRYLQPIKTDRRHARNHFVDIDDFHRKFSLEHKGLTDGLSEKQKRLLQKFTQSIKFK